MEIRLATQADSAGIIALIDRVYGEYGDRVNLEGAEGDLLDLEANYFGKGGQMWVLDRRGEIMGSHAAFVQASDPSISYFRRLYLDSSLRGQEWGARLMQLTIDWAIEQGCRRVEFWSDTRFHRAHRFFEKFGFRPTGEVRHMSDGHIPYSEKFFRLELPPSDTPSPAKS